MTAEGSPSARKTSRKALKSLNPRSGPARDSEAADATAADEPDGHREALSAVDGFAEARHAGLDERPKNPPQVLENLESALGSGARLEALAKHIADRRIVPEPSLGWQDFYSSVASRSHRAGSGATSG